jgi:hypothetical protein
VTENANPGLGKAQDYFKDFVWDTAVDAAIITPLFAAVPVLAIWLVNAMIRYLVHFAADKLYAGIKLLVDLQAIAFVNNQHRKAFDSAAVTLKIIARNKGIDSEEFRKAKENAKIALSEYVRFHGT